MTTVPDFKMKMCALQSLSSASQIYPVESSWLDTELMSKSLYRIFTELEELHANGFV